MFASQYSTVPHHSRRPCAPRRRSPQPISRLATGFVFVGVATLAALAAADPAPTNLTAIVNDATVELTWTPPDPASGNIIVRVLRRLNVDPVDANDPNAAIVYEDTGSHASDPVAGLLPSVSGTPRQYHYAAFGCNGSTCEPNGSRTTLSLDLVQCLHAGGYVIRWRHADADVCADHTDLGTAGMTSVPDWWKSCDANCPTATARQMNA